MIIFIQCSFIISIYYIGLDASTAQNVMGCLYNLSRQGREL
jgi:hypothetical protein